MASASDPFKSGASIDAPPGDAQIRDTAGCGSRISSPSRLLGDRAPCFVWHRLPRERRRGTHQSAGPIRLHFARTNSSSSSRAWRSGMTRLVTPGSEERVNAALDALAATADTEPIGMLLRLNRPRRSRTSAATSCQPRRSSRPPTRRLPTQILDLSGPRVRDSRACPRVTQIDPSQPLSRVVTRNSCVRFVSELASADLAEGYAPHVNWPFSVGARGLEPPTSAV